MTGTEGKRGREGRRDGHADRGTDGHSVERVPFESSGVALFVDGPNMLREEFDVDLDDVRAAAATSGHLVTARLYLDEHATPGLIQAAEARGFEVIVTSGDVDVKLAVDAVTFVLERRMATLAIASRDTDFKPVVEVANGNGIRTLAIAPGKFGRSDALPNAATDAVTLDGDVVDGSDEDRIGERSTNATLDSGTDSI